MSRLSAAVARVLRWPVGRTPGGSRARTGGHLALEVGGTVRITPSEDGRIEASIVGRIHAPRGARDDDARDGTDAERSGDVSVEVRGLSTVAVAGRDPIAWLQLFDDDGVALTHEVLLGHALGAPYEFHARIDMVTRVRPLQDASPRPPAPTPNGEAPRTLDSGLRARVVTRSYRDGSGPQYRVEALMLTLMDAGAEFPGRPSLQQPAPSRSHPSMVPRPRPSDVSVPA